MHGRDWERWDEPEVARKIDEGWHCPGELSYRLWLAHKLVQEGLQPTDRVLEVGCGTGLFYDALRRSTSASYVGVDSSVEMLRIAQARFQTS